MNLIPLPRMSEYLIEDFMIPMGLTALDVSAGAGIPLDTLRALLTDKQQMTQELSKKLGSYFGVSGDLFYDIQQDLNERSEEPVLRYA